MVYFFIHHHFYWLGSCTPSFTLKVSFRAVFWTSPHRLTALWSLLCLDPVWELAGKEWNLSTQLKELKGNSECGWPGYLVQWTVIQWMICLVTIPPDSTPVLPVRIWTAIVPDEPYRVKGAGSGVGLYPTLHIRCCPHLLVIPLVVCVLVFSIPSTFDLPTPALYLGFHLQQSWSVQYCSQLVIRA